MSLVRIHAGQQAFPIGDDQPVFVIAEIGKNFIQQEVEQSTEAYLANAMALVKAAKQAGAHAVKFQTHHAEDEQAALQVISPHFLGSDRYAWVSRNERATPVETFWRPLKEQCDREGIIFFSTPMSRGAAEKLAAIDTPFWKVGSGDVLDFVMLDFMRRSGKPIVLSTGMSTREEIDRAVAFLREKTDQIVLLHCVSRYPCPPEELRLRTIGYLKKRYGLPVGFSDHSIGTDSAIAAAALGACVIEKHFSFDRSFWGSDHKVSLLPHEMMALTEGVRRVRDDVNFRNDLLQSDIVVRGMGQEEKMLDEHEAVFRPLFRKTLCASQDLPAGTILEQSHFYAMRPQTHLNGFPSEAYPDLLGRALRQPLHRYQPMHADAFSTEVATTRTRRKICVVIINRANYGRVKSVLKAIRRHPNLELQIVAGSSLLLERYGRAADIVRADGFDISAELHTAVEGETPLTMAKSVGLGIIEITNALNHLKPDAVVTVADRFETMATAVAASYMNIPVAHIQGGEVTGSIDESVRHAVTKLSHLHFPATEKSRERLIKMGEDPSSVVCSGCPSLDLIYGSDLSFTQEELSHLGYLGVGVSVDFSRPYLLMMQHPVTTEYGSGYHQIMETVEAIVRIGMPTVALWPNIDAGSDDISKGLRVFREINPNAPFRFYKNFSPELYYKILMNTVCAIGNSSSFIREGSFLGTPAVIVGSRQEGREHGLNARFDVPHEREAIERAIREQSQHGRYSSDTTFGDGHADERIAEALARASLRIQKRLSY